MKNSIGISLIVSMMMALTACGGDSDSSGDTVDEVIPPSTTQLNACVEEGYGHFKVPDEGCTFTADYYNNGQTVTFTCDGTTLINSLGASAPLPNHYTDHNFYCE